MTVTELKHELVRQRVPNNLYSLLAGGLPNEVFCLVYEKGVWEVYYSERGKKRGAKAFASESDACAYLLRKLDVAKTERRRGNT